MAEFESSGKKPLMISTGGSDSLGIWGYIAAAEELSQISSRTTLTVSQSHWPQVLPARKPAHCRRRIVRFAV